MDTDIIKIFLWLAFGGWGLYLTSERRRIVGDIKSVKKESADIKARVDVNETLMKTSYWTKEDHARFEDRVTAAVDRLSNRIDKVLEEIIRKT